PGELFLNSPSSRYDMTSGGSATISGRKANIVTLVPKKTNIADTPAEEALTGPVIRGETDTIRRHLEAVRGDPEARAVYKRMSLAALEIASRAGTDPERIEEMRKLLL